MDKLLLNPVVSIDLDPVAIQSGACNIDRTSDALDHPLLTNAHGTVGFITIIIMMFCDDACVMMMMIVH